MNSGSQKLRIAAGIGVLVALAVLALMLARPYYENYQFQRFLDTVAHRPENAAAPLDMILVQVVNYAGSRGLPVKRDQVQVDRNGDRVKIGVRYFVHVDLTAYTVDLHFHPVAGGQ